MSRLLFSLAIVLAGLAAGFLLQTLYTRGGVRLPVSPVALRKLLQKIGLLVFMNVSFASTIWVVQVRDLRIAALPLLGLTVLTAGGLLALGAARALALTRPRTGALFVCGAFTNIGAIGALVVYVFLGEAGFALVPLYKLFEEPLYYAVGFPIAKYFGPAGAPREPLGARLGRVFGDTFVRAALGALLVGGALNLLGVPRPEVFGAINAVFIPLGTFVLLTSIGMAMRFGSLREHLSASLAVAGIKFLVLPALGTALGLALGLGQVASGMPLKVVLVLASMPVAFVALIPPSIYDLDLDLANACWLVTTLGLVVVLPVLHLVLAWI
jgi:predicted permease